MTVKYKKFSITLSNSIKTDRRIALFQKIIPSKGTQKTWYKKYVEMKQKLRTNIDKNVYVKVYLNIIFFFKYAHSLSHRYL